jgi:predicted metalloenzyme YecM
MAYLPDNLKLLCRLCHHWWHENPKEAWEWIETVLPKERIKRLHQLARSIIYEPLDYERISRGLKAQIELFASQT